MRFVVLIKSNARHGGGIFPDEELRAEMGTFNEEELTRAGVLLAAEGLLPSGGGVRVKFSGQKTTVIDGLFSGDEGTDRRLLATGGEVEGRGDESVKRVQFAGN